MEAVALTHAADAYEAFTDEQRLILERFISRVRELQRSSFFEHPENRMTATFTNGVLSDVRADSPGEEAVRAITGLFRECYLGSNPTSAQAVLKMLSRNARMRGTLASVMVRDELSQVRAALTERRQVDPRMYVLEEGRSGPRTPDEITDLFLNGEYFHFRPAQGC